jgi:hypothetical protein
VPASVKNVYAKKRCGLRKVTGVVVTVTFNVDVGQATNEFLHIS